MRRAFLFLICLVTPISVAAQSKFTLFDEICQIVSENFYIPEKIETTFKANIAHYRERISRAGDDDFARIVNQMLAELKTSHTRYFTRRDPEYYQLAAIFQALPNIQALFDHEEIRYPSIGILSREIEGKNFVISVLAGSPAEKAGLLAGDEILTLDARSYGDVQTLMAKVDQILPLRIRRHRDMQPMTLHVEPRLINPKQEFLDAEQNSVRLIERGDHKIGYIHIWSYAGREYHDAFVDEIAFGKLKEADALIWDLRDGWGGASASYLNVFNREVPVYTRIDRDGNRRPFDSQWRKPVAMLINGGVRSGKEILAYGFKKHKLGAIIGQRTAGAVAAGKLFILPDESILYLAVGGALIDGEVLEGVGVAPDIAVEMDIRYAAGADPQLQTAIEILSETLQTNDKN